MAQIKLLKIASGLQTEHSAAADDLSMLSVSTDTVNERTAAAGVTIDGVLIKDAAIGSGAWNGSVISGTYGGTGVNNGASTITLGGNLVTSGAFSTTLTATGTTTVTLPTSGTLATTAVATLSSLTSIGTIGTGVWQGSIITGTYGGTGVNNGSSTITLGGNLTTSGSFTTTLTVTGNTNVTLPTSGTLVNSAVTTLSSLVSVGTITTGVWHGTAVTVDYGGTGLTSATAYAVLCGGTTSTGALQPLASVGSSGQVLTSNGAGALPSWQSASAAADVYPFTMAAGNSVVKGDVVYKTATNDEVAIADADTVSQGTLIVGLANATIGATASGNIFCARGKVITAVLTAATAGTVYYLSSTGTSTNTLTTTPPSGGPALVRIGFAVNATDLLFDPLFIADTTA